MAAEGKGIGSSSAGAAPSSAELPWTEVAPVPSLPVDAPAQMVCCRCRVQVAAWHLPQDLWIVGPAAVLLPEEVQGWHAMTLQQPEAPSTLPFQHLWKLSSLGPSKAPKGPFCFRMSSVFALVETAR